MHAVGDFPQKIKADRGNNSNLGTAAYDRLKEIDPVAANRIHPNDHRKVRYL